MQFFIWSQTERYILSKSDRLSALAATLGAFGQVGYVAANLYQDAVAEVNKNHYPIISIEWTLLQETGMAVNSLKHLSAQESKDRLRYGIDSSEAIAVLNYAL